MYGGFSGSQGIILYNTKKKENNGVYGYYDGDQMILLEGEYMELREKQKEIEESYEENLSQLYKLMAMVLVVYALITIGAFVTGPFRLGLAVLVFAACSYFPLLVILAAQTKSYRTKALTAQFRRFHGCEHQAVSWLTRAESGDMVTFDDLQKKPIFDSECGTAYAGYCVTMSAVLALLIANPMGIGLLKACGMFLLVVVLLVLNVFNPWNPFLLLQKSVVAEPGEREYHLAAAMIEKLQS